MLALAVGDRALVHVESYVSKLVRGRFRGLLTLRAEFPGTILVCRDVADISQ